MKRPLLFGVGLLLLVSLLNMTAQGAARKVLAELITSTTCAPCYNPDVFYFYQWLPNYGGADNIVTIAYHVWWPAPGNDPMYLANPVPVQVRHAYYSPSGGFAPRMFIDGFIDGGSGYTSWPGAIEPRFLDPSPISITLTGSRSGNTLNMNARITAEMPVNSTNWRVHWVVVESEISAPQNSPSGYVPFIHKMAHREMYPDANGSPIAISQGQTVDIPRVITLNSSWVANNCKVIVFVQNNTDKKSQQAEILPVDQITSAGTTEEIPDVFALHQNYPNPFNPSTRIEYSVAAQSFVSVKVFNLLGKEVRTLAAQINERGNHFVEWDGRDDAGVDVPSGMYIYQMTAGEFRSSKKMMLVK